MNSNFGGVIDITLSTRENGRSIYERESFSNPLSIVLKVPFIGYLFLWSYKWRK